MAVIGKILVANRGEIALRVMRSAKDMGVATVAVYSEADRDAPHVSFADEAVLIGAGPVGESYLVADKILQAAAQTGADAIHPGYGFLSENADFAEAVNKAGLTFIGPSAEAISLMGNKAEAKRRMIAAGVPCIPGYEEADQADATLIAAGEEIGFPLMVKAAAGGGGRGMRLVEHKKELTNAIATARSEAENAFGSGELILEKAILNPRHVEVQVFADTHGTTLHFGERDCSVQRRHQKVIEEAPCPVMTDSLRDEMGQAAIQVAESIGYEGAGTVEFLLDADGGFYFLEMNTRLQVEHPVTELVTGLDLVALQIKVAAGEPLGLTQTDVRLTGHAIEIRLYAEDPANDFLPSTGEIVGWQQPDLPGIRYDVGVRQGQQISPHYDPMVGKVIGYGESREIARARLVEALRRIVFLGPSSNRDFLLDCLMQDDFVNAAATTGFIGSVYGAAGFTASRPDERLLSAQAVCHFLHDRQHALEKTLDVPDALLNFSGVGQLRTPYRLAFDDSDILLQVQTERDGCYKLTIEDMELAVEVGSMDVTPHGLRVDLRVDGVDMSAVTVRAAGKVHTAMVSPERAVNIVTENLLTRRAGQEEGAGGGLVKAPMHGRVIEVFVNAEDNVTNGDRLAIIEAMKMQHEIFAEIDGQIAEVLVVADQQVGVDDLMIEITESETDS